MIDIKVKRLKSDAKLPTYGSKLAAGMDLYACLDTPYVVIPPHSCKKIGTGLAFQPPKGYCGKIYARSGMATKQNLRPANCVGLCDEDYTGEYIVALHNDSDDSRVVHQGDRIAQLIFEKYQQFNLVVVDKIEETERSSGGFGSTGI